MHGRRYQTFPIDFLVESQKGGQLELDKGRAPARSTVLGKSVWGRKESLGIGRCMNTTHETWGNRKKAISRRAYGLRIVYVLATAADCRSLAEVCRQC